MIPPFVTALLPKLPWDKILPAVGIVLAVGVVIWYIADAEKNKASVSVLQDQNEQISLINNENNLLNNQKIEVIEGHYETKLLREKRYDAKIESLQGKTDDNGMVVHPAILDALWMRYDAQNRRHQN